MHGAEDMGEKEKTVTKTTLEMRVLRRAAELLGSELALARHLRVAQPDLFACLSGTEKPTRAMFVEAVDVLIAFDETNLDVGSMTNPGDVGNPDRTDGGEKKPAA
jgi:hypothetical protein